MYNISLTFHSFDLFFVLLYKLMYNIRVDFKAAMDQPCLLIYVLFDSSFTTGRLKLVTPHYHRPCMQIEKFSTFSQVYVCLLKRAFLTLTR